MITQLEQRVIDNVFKSAEMHKDTLILIPDVSIFQRALPKWVDTLNCIEIEYGNTVNIVPVSLQDCGNRFIASFDGK